MELARAIVAIAGLAMATPAVAADDLRAGFEGALRGCEAWVLDPSSWAGGYAPFLARMALGEKAGLVREVAAEALPPKPLRASNHYWRINSTSESGYILITSDQVPMCHITGGGQADLQPVVETVLASSTFTARWRSAGEERRGDIVTTTYRYLQDPKFSMVVSRAGKAGGRTDRVQVVTTAIFQLDN